MIITNMFNESYLIFWSIAALTAYILYLIFKRFRLFNDYSDDYNYLPSNCYDTRYTNEEYAFFDSYLQNNSGISTENFDVELNEITIEEIDCDDAFLELPAGIAPIIEEPTDDNSAENSSEKQLSVEEISVDVEAGNNFDRIMPLAIEYNVSIEERCANFVDDEMDDNNFDRIMPLAIEYNVSIEERCTIFVDEEMDDNNCGQVMHNNVTGNFPEVHEVLDNVNECQSHKVEDVRELEELAGGASSSVNDKPKKKKRKRVKRFFRGLFCFGCVKGAKE